MYAADHDGMLPASGWCDALVPYVEGERVFSCPEAWRLRSA